jgi:RNA polymerase sigma-70 factor (ECF subfamily)
MEFQTPVAGVLLRTEVSGTSSGSRGNIVEPHMRDEAQRTDRELVARFRGGEREAFAALYAAHFPAVFRFAFFMTGDRARAGEVTQDVFVWLVHHPGDFDPERGDLASFLTGVARKYVHRLQRSERRWLPLDNAAAAREEFPNGLEREQEAAELRKAIAALPERYREAVVLCDLEERSYEQAAEALGCATGTVRSRLHRARGLLARKVLRAKEGQKCL